jgi:hypothetical protein
MSFMIKSIRPCSASVNAFLVESYKSHKNNFKKAERRKEKLHSKRPQTAPNYRHSKLDSLSILEKDNENQLNFPDYDRRTKTNTFSSDDEENNETSGLLLYSMEFESDTKANILITKTEDTVFGDLNDTNDGEDFEYVSKSVFSFTSPEKINLNNASVTEENLNLAINSNYEIPSEETKEYKSIISVVSATINNSFSADQKIHSSNNEKQSFQEFTDSDVDKSLLKYDDEFDSESNEVLRDVTKSVSFVPSLNHDLALVDQLDNIEYGTNIDNKILVEGKNKALAKEIRYIMSSSTSEGLNLNDPKDCRRNISSVIRELTKGEYFSENMNSNDYKKNQFAMNMSNRRNKKVIEKTQSFPLTFVKTNENVVCSTNSNDIDDESYFPSPCYYCNQRFKGEC